MARYEHLPIYKQAMDVAVHFEKLVADFSRYHKYTLGTELRNKSREIVSHIIRANAEHDKAPYCWCCAANSMNYSF
ncbi:MAG TPA: four helix bundle protein [Lamprocystis sp. (in: g-proteobacteria)]|nr:four helix bundle protein [Lamprocystis sp. (in: g-proteobacteria)]